MPHNPAVRSLSLLVGWAAVILVASAANRTAHRKFIAVQQNSQPEDTTTVVNRFNDAFNRQDLTALEALLAADTVFEDTSPAPDGTRVEGKPAVVAFWREWFKRNPGAQFETEEMIVCGDRAVVRWIYRKVRNGQPWHLRGVDVFRVHNGKVAAKLAYVKG